MSAENPPISAQTPAEQRKSRRTLLLVAAVCIAPFIERIERAFLTNDAQPVAAIVVKEYEGTWFAQAQGGAQLKTLPVGTQQGTQLSDHIYRVDPLGNVVLRFPKDADPSRMKKDLQRLLRVSRIG